MVSLVPAFSAVAETLVASETLVKEKTRQTGTPVDRDQTAVAEKAFPVDWALPAPGPSR